MKQKIKQTLIVIVGLLLSTTAFAHDFEVDGIFYNYLDETAKTVRVTYKGNYSSEYYNEYTGAVTIPSSVTYNGITYSVTWIGYNAFSACTGLTSITIPNSVTEIKDGVFSGCSGLKELIIEDGNETLSLGYNTSNGKGLFYDCPIEKLYLGRNLSYNTNSYYDYSPFFNCDELTSVTIGNSVTKIGDYAFFSCDGLEELIIEDGTETLSLGYNEYDYYSTGKGLFYDCPIEKLYLGRNLSYNTGSDYGYSPFYNCDKLTSVTIGNSVTSIGNEAFRGCSGLTEVNISDLSAWCKIDFGNYSANPLYYAKKLKLNGTVITNLVIPNDITQIKDCAFENCSGLTSVTIPNSVTSIGNSAFNGCTGLTELIIEDGTETLSLGYNEYDNDDYDYVGEGLFYDCPIEKLYLGRNLRYYTGSYYGYSPFFNCDELTSVTIGNSVTKIGDYAFYKCTGLTSVTIPNSVTEIGYSAFRDCSGLTSVSIPNSVTKIGNSAFSYCNGLTSVTIGSGVESIGESAFSTIPYKTIWLTNTPPSGYSYASGTVNYVANDQYSSLSNVTIYPFLSSLFEVDGIKYVPVSPSERTCDAIDCSYNHSDSVINISNSVSFKGVAMIVKDIKPYTCYGNDYIRECTINYAGNIGEFAFYSCDRLESLNLSVNEIGKYAFQNSATKNPATFSIDTKSISDYAFNGCSAVENATINAETIGEYAFQYCATINPATFSIDAKSIANYAFNGCSAVETITLGNELKTIGSSAFSSCSNLTEIVIPDSVNSIGSSAFSGCSSLASAIVGNAVNNINDETFYNCKSLENIIIGTEVKTIGKNTFYGCSALPIIEIPKNVTSIGNYAFDNCSKLSDVIINDRDTVLTLGSNGSSPIFNDCPLDSVYIGGNILYNTSSSCGYSPFYNNKTLRTVTITDKETEISENEFYGCANLRYVSIGDDVETIGSWAFSGCSSLDYFAFGSSVNAIGEEAFSDCTAVTKIYSRAATPPACGTQALDDINKWTCELFVPGASIKSYQTADQWKEFFFISEDAGVEDVLIDNVVVKIAVENGNISINGIENPHIEIYNINGKCIYSGNDTTIPVSGTSVYILKINGKSYKIAI